MMLGYSIGKNSVILGVFALATASLLAGTFQVTKSKIAAAERAAAERALADIVDSNRHDNDLLTDTLPIEQKYWSRLGLEEGGNIHVARSGKQVVAVIIPAVAPDGYSGDIKLIIGVNTDGSLAGVRTLSHTETPGLGDKVDLKKSDWILSFTGKSLLNPKADQWFVKKDGGVFDQFTGATITPRAVVRQVKATLEFAAEQHEDLFLPEQKEQP